MAKQRELSLRKRQFRNVVYQFEADFSMYGEYYLDTTESIAESLSGMI